jgi:hypothetical protein
VTWRFHHVRLAWSLSQSVACVRACFVLLLLFCGLLMLGPLLAQKQVWF